MMKPLLMLCSSLYSLECTEGAHYVKVGMAWFTSSVVIDVIAFVFSFSQYSSSYVLSSNLCTPRLDPIGYITVIVQSYPIIIHPLLILPGTLRTNHVFNHQSPTLAYKSPNNILRTFTRGVA